MCVIEMQLFKVIIILWACSSSESVPPTIILANGTALFDRQIIGVLYGELLELFCTGQDYELWMTENYTQLLTVSVNKTTIRWFVERPEKGFLHYTCNYIKTIISYYSDTSDVMVVVDLLPITENFLCKSMNFEYLNCSWTSKHFQPTYLLYYVSWYDGIPRLLCKTVETWLDHAKNCLWDKSHPLLRYEDDTTNLRFIMNTCTVVGCTNQTFDLDHRTIVKPKAPEFKLVSKRSHGVFLDLQHNIYLGNEKNPLEKKISYWYSGIQQNEGNALLVSTTSNFTGYSNDEFELKLPCANRFYEVRAAIRSQLAVGEEFWSDDAVIIHVVTDPAPEDDDEAVDPTCNQPKPQVTRDVMLY